MILEIVRHLISSLWCESAWICFEKLRCEWVRCRGMWLDQSDYLRGERGAEPLLERLPWGGCRVLIPTEPSWKAPQSESHFQRCRRSADQSAACLTFLSFHSPLQLWCMFFFFLLHSALRSSDTFILYFLICATERPNARKGNVCSQRNLCRFHSLKVDKGAVHCCER